MSEPTLPINPRDLGWLDRLIYFCLRNRLVVVLSVAFSVVWGVIVAPFDWQIDWLPRQPIAVDAIPDIGENQQIVFTEWRGRSPQDVEAQVTQPLTGAMLGMPGVKTVRSYSMFGFSSIYVIFKEGVDFYWSRSRILEKLNSLSKDSLPPDVQPVLGPDATALGQVFWYTLEGRDEDGNVTGGWDPHELRSIQDWDIRYNLLSADGIAEVASVGGYVQEYQIDVDPDAMRAHGVTLDQVFAAVQMSNVDVGARTIEVNKVEYVIRGLGLIDDIEDLEGTIIKANDNVPIFIRNVANVSLGPAWRRGALDKGGAEVVGGVAVVRYGGNPLAAIKALKEKITEISPGLPAKIIIDYSKVSAQDVRQFASDRQFRAFDRGHLDHPAWLDWLASTSRAERPDWLTVSKIAIIPFYDRTNLIYETLGTLRTALSQQILVTIIVIIIMVMHLRSSAVIAATLPLAVLMCFIAMKSFGIDANVVALSGIAIAIGTIVDMGVIMCENILRHLDSAPSDEDRLQVVFRASREVAGAVLTAIATTIIGFLPVFTMIGAEGKLFQPLAFTKTFALFASVIVALAVVPVLAHCFFTFRISSRRLRHAALFSLVAAGIACCFFWIWWLGVIVVCIAAWHLLAPKLPDALAVRLPRLANLLLAVLFGILLTQYWLPLGPAAGFLANAVVVLGPMAGLLTFFLLFARYYEYLLEFLLRFKTVSLLVPLFMILLGILICLGMRREFMPDLDEGSYLYMPSTMQHASIGEALDVLQKQDKAFAAIPEIALAVGKIGRAESALDPAPISMVETIINYKPQYLVDRDGKRLRFKFDAEATDFFRNELNDPVIAPDGLPYKVRGAFKRDADDRLIDDPGGMPFRVWRPALDPELNSGRPAWPGIRNADDIWQAIAVAGEIPGTTAAPKLQPIAARLVMLQTGMRAPMGVKIKGPDLATIEGVGLELERLLKEVPGVEADAVIADRIVGKPYIEIEIDRDAIARYGIRVGAVQDIIEIAIGGRHVTTTVEGRKRYPVRVRYQRELRDSIEDLGQVLVPGRNGQQIPLLQLSEIRYVRGLQTIKSEGMFLVGHVLLDKRPGFAEVDVVESCKAYLNSKIDSGELKIPQGVTFTFDGTYESQLRASKTLRIVLPLALFIIFMILYVKFKSVPVTLIVFSSILVAWAGGFVLLWFYGQPGFMDFELFGTNVRDFFQVSPVNMSVAVWVGFLALFGIASDDGVVMTTYLEQTFAGSPAGSIADIRSGVVVAAKRRIRPCLMTTATTIFALLPVLTSPGRGAEIMVPMAIPCFGGMLIALMTMFVVPVLYCLVQETRFRFTRLAAE